MRKYIASAVMLIGALFLTSILAVPVSAASVDAPTYDKDDGWAIGQEIEIDWKWSEMDDELKQMVNETVSMLEMTLYGSNFTVNALEAGGDAAFYVVLKVQDVTEDEYVLNAKMAIKLATNANIAVHGELPKTGEYNISYQNYLDSKGIETEEMTVSFDFTEEFAVIIGATVYMEKETLAINKIELTLDAAAVVSIDGKNIPMIDDSDVHYKWPLTESYALVSVAYKDYDVKAKAVLEAKMTFKFTPALNIYEFPLEVGSEWQIDSVMNVTGEVDGFIDVTGLPEEIEDEFFGEDSMFEGLNITGFPIDLKDLIPGDLLIVDGKLKPFETNILADLACTDERTVKIFGEDKNVHVIEAVVDGDGGETVEFYYTADLIDLLGSVELMAGGDLPVDMDMLETLGITIDLNNNITVEQAEDKIKAIEAYEQSVANKARGTDGEFPTLLVIGAVAIIAVALVGVMLIRRKK